MTRLERAAHWCRWGMVGMQALLIACGFWAVGDGARATGSGLGVAGLVLTLLMIGGDFGRRRPQGSRR